VPDSALLLFSLFILLFSVISVLKALTPRFAHDPHTSYNCIKRWPPLGR
jgi:hypothetical protein